MSPHVESFVWPELRRLGRGRALTTGAAAQLICESRYSSRRMYDFFRELEVAGLLKRRPRGKVWLLA